MLRVPQEHVCDPRLFNTTRKLLHTHRARYILTFEFCEVFYLLPNLKFSFLKFIDQSLYVPFRKSNLQSFSEENVGFP